MVRPIRSGLDGWRSASSIQAPLRDSTAGRGQRHRRPRGPGLAEARALALGKNLARVLLERLGLRQ